MAMQLRFFLSMGILLFSGCVKNVAEDPEQDCSEQEAFYVENIAPLMSQSCLVCHSGPSPAGNPPLSLDSFISSNSSNARLSEKLLLKSLKNDLIFSVAVLSIAVTLPRRYILVIVSK